MSRRPSVPTGKRSDDGTGPIELTYGSGALQVHEFNADWPTWEIHPSGDEIVVLQPGTATLVLRGDDGETRVQLAGPGAYVVVPRNTWHTARVSGTTRMLFITPGEGTENRADPDSLSS